MTQKSKLEMQIETALKRIENEQKRLKLLQNAQSEKERKERNHRLCKRHGFLESILPETISLTDEQFQAFVKQHIANQYGKRVLANFAVQNAEAVAVAHADEKQQSDGESASTIAGQNNGNNAPKNQHHADGNSQAVGATA
ncbi:MAG: DUF3847 domain-containing protein [Defluviitaleaceae bacterium]|nr:DUF3847 domain-containing protein [Defluviitaleaceae bacterium]